MHPIRTAALCWALALAGVSFTETETFQPTLRSTAAVGLSQDTASPDAEAGKKKKKKGGEEDEEDLAPVVLPLTAQA